MRRNRESRKIVWAVLAAILVHLAVAFALAAFGGRLGELPEPENKAPELTLVEMPVPKPLPSAPKNPMFMETDPSKKSAVAPKEKTFESNENSIAASELPAAGDSLLPTQNGKGRNPQDLVNQAPSLALEGAPPQPPRSPKEPEKKPAPTPAASAAPSATVSPTPENTPSPVATPKPDEFAMLTATPPPAMTPPNETEPSPPPEASLASPPPRPQPEQPSSAYHPYKQRARISGQITNRGASAVNAVGTPLGRYQKAIYDAIGSRWLYYTKKQNDLIAIGTARVSFFVDRNGHVENLKMIGNTSNESFANVCLGSVQDAKLPATPPEVADILPSEGLNVELSFTLFANQ